jgi:thiol-disulfide isomerase/thioredoxin
VADEGEGKRRRTGIPLSAVILATIAAALVTTLFVTVVLDAGEADEASEANPETLLLQPGDPGEGIPTGEDPSGTPAPDFDFEALALDGIDGGDEINFAAYQDGRPVVLNFFGSWCAPCVREMPDLEAVSQDLSGDVVFLGLAERESSEDSLEIVETTGVTYDIGRDPGGDILTAFEGLAMPTTVFIAADGTITSVHSGALTADDLRERIEAELS